MPQPHIAATARFIAIVLVSLMLSGAVSSCSRQPDNSAGRDSDPHEVAHSDDILLATALLKWKAKIEAKQKDASSAPVPTPNSGRARPNASEALLEAAQLGDAKLVESLLARGVDRKTLNQALLVAARSEPLVLGPNDAIDLHYAAIARLLLKKGAMLEARDVDGSTPLIWAASRGETAVVKLLVEKGAQIEATSNTGGTALIAAACNCPIVDMPDTDNSVRLLLEHGANIEARDKQGGTALIHAASWGRTSILQILLDQGAMIDARDNRGKTALLSASSGSGYPTAEAVQLLLVRGADIEARNNDGVTALMLAATNGGFEDVKIVKMLLNRGADVRTQDKNGRTSLDLAIGKGRTRIVPLLRAATTRSR
jgi:ankyrin repeat protein